MIDQFLKMFKLEGLLDNIKGYIDTKIQMVKVEVMEKVSNIIATLMLLVLCGFMVLMVFVFMSLALGNYLNSLLDSSYLGYIIMGLFFLVIVVILGITMSSGFFHKKLKNLTANMINKKY